MTMRRFGILLLSTTFAVSCVALWAFLSSEEPQGLGASPDGATATGHPEEADGRPREAGPRSTGRLVATGRTEPPEPNAMTVCLGERGFASVPYRGTKRGYVPNSPVPPEGQLGFLKAERTCAERTGYGEPVSEPDPAELESRYEDVISTKECLEREGYLVVETPSLKEFVWVRGAWDPYASLVARDLGYIGDGEYLRLGGLCPNPLPR